MGIPEYNPEIIDSNIKRFEFGPVEQSYRDAGIDDELWQQWAQEHPDLALEAVHEANKSQVEGVTARDSFLRGLKFATRLERDKKEAQLLEQQFNEAI